MSELVYKAGEVLNSMTEISLEECMEFIVAHGTIENWTRFVKLWGEDDGE